MPVYLYKCRTCGTEQEREHPASVDLSGGSEFMEDLFRCSYSEWLAQDYDYYRQSMCNTCSAVEDSPLTRLIAGGTGVHSSWSSWRTKGKE